MNRILTWLQVTSDQFHIGNYFWAVKPIIDASAGENEVFLMVASMHSLTTVLDGSIRQNTINSMKLYLACGVDPQKVFFFNQADVAWHAQLARVFSCYTHMGFMERMHAYKDKIDKKKANEVPVGLFTYPILMATDILLYDATHVPTGQDQKQHVEYARDIAGKFNHLYWEIFVLPEPVINTEVAVIPWTDGRKMSKSKNNYIWFLDTDEDITKKIKKIPTAAIAVEEPKDPDECNVYKIYKLFLTPEEDDILRKRYTDWWLSFGEVKMELAAKVTSFVWPIRDRFQSISDQEVIDLLTKNAPRANELASKKVQEVYEKIGFSL